MSTHMFNLNIDNDIAHTHHEEHYIVFNPVEFMVSYLDDLVISKHISKWQMTVKCMAKPNEHTWITGNCVNT